MEDIAEALTDSLPRDGSAPMTGNLPMGSNKITGLAAATLASDAVRFDQVPNLTGLTATVTELNYTDGVTSPIQAQLDAKQATITTLALANGGTGAALADPGADRLMFWDDSAGATAYLTPGTGVTISGTTLTVNSAYTWLTPQTTTSGTAFDFTGIPSGVTEIVVAFSAVSLSGSDSVVVQIGDSGGFETTGYDGGLVLTEASAIATNASSAVGFDVPLLNSSNAARGIMQLIRPFSDNEWLSSMNMSRGAQYMFSAQSKTLSDTLTQVRVTRIGANTFDLGKVNVGYR